MESGQFSAYKCSVCDFIYNQHSAMCLLDGNMQLFEHLDADWQCPTCGADQRFFQPVDDISSPRDSG